MQYATICPYHNNILLLVVRGALQPAAGAKPPFADVAVEIEGVPERIYASVPDARSGCLVTTAASAGLQQNPSKSLPLNTREKRVFSRDSHLWRPIYGCVMVCLVLGEWDLSRPRSIHIKTMACPFLFPSFGQSVFTKLFTCARKKMKVSICVSTTRQLFTVACRSAFWGTESLFQLHHRSGTSNSGRRDWHSLAPC